MDFLLAVVIPPPVGNKIIDEPPMDMLINSRLWLITKNSGYALTNHVQPMLHAVLTDSMWNKRFYRRQC